MPNIIKQHLRVSDRELRHAHRLYMSLKTVRDSVSDSRFGAEELTVRGAGTTVRGPAIARKEQERLMAREQLLKILKPGDTVYTVLRHRSVGGGYRAFDVFLIAPDVRQLETGAPTLVMGISKLRLTRLVCQMINARYDRKFEALKTLIEEEHAVELLSTDLFGYVHALQHEML